MQVHRRFFLSWLRCWLLVSVQVHLVSFNITLRKTPVRFWQGDCLVSYRDKFAQNDLYLCVGFEQTFTNRKVLLFVRNFSSLADLGHFLEQFGQHPQKENRVEAWRAHQFFRAQNVDDSAPVGAAPQKIIDVEFRFAEKIRRALIFEDQQAALDRADRRGRHVPVGLGYFRRSVAEMLQQRPKILEIDEQQTLFVGEPEGDVENAFLDVIEFEQAGQEQGPHIRWRGPDALTARRGPKT